MPHAQSKGSLATFVAVPRLAISVFLALVIATILAGCGNRDNTAPVIVSSIVVTAPDGAIPVTGTMQFVALVTDADGNTVTTTPVWTVVHGGGTITSGGLFTAGDSVGTFANTILATIGAVTGTSSVTVSAGGLAHITITPAIDTLAVDATKQFAAVATDGFGHVLPTPALVWTVSSPTAGTVDTSGHFSAGSVAGAYTITATSGAIAGSASILVIAGPLTSILIAPDTATLAIEATQQYTAVGHDVHGNVVAVTPTWATTGGGSISGAGLYTAGDTSGTYATSISATNGLVSGSASVIITPGPLATIVVTPANPILFVGGSLQFLAAGHDAHGNLVATTVAWSIAAGQTAAGSISGTGVFAASTTSGTYPNAIVATSGLISGSTSVTIFTFILPCGGGPCIPFPP